jgi:hypothetical protein
MQANSNQAEGLKQDLQPIDSPFSDLKAKVDQIVESQQPV